MKYYYTVVIPYVSALPTQWHPTTPDFAPLTRGAFKTEAEAHAWAKAHLRPFHDYSLRACPDATWVDARVRHLYGDGEIPDTIPEVDYLSGVWQHA